MTRFTIYTSFVAGAVGSFADLYGQIQKTVGATSRVRELLLAKEPGTGRARGESAPPLIFQGARGNGPGETSHRRRKPHPAAGGRVHPWAGCAAR